MTRDGWNRNFFSHLREHSGRATAPTKTCQRCGQTSCPCGQDEAQKAVEAARALVMPKGTHYADKIARQFTRAIPAGPTYEKWSINNLRACADEIASMYRAGARANSPEAQATQNVVDLLKTAFNAFP